MPRTPRRADGRRVPWLLGRSPPHDERRHGAVRPGLTGLEFADCADERVSGTFLYAARDGIVFRGKTNASVLIHGTDTGCRAFVSETERGFRVKGALVQLVSLGAKAESSISAPEGSAGELVLFATQFWPRYPLLDQRGPGRTVLDQFNGVAGPVKVFDGAEVTHRGCVSERGPFEVGRE